jgi:hypothetical protein
MRRGVAAMLLGHIVGQARARSRARLSLETGTGPAFEPALAFYRAHGFLDSDACNDYPRTPFNRLLHLRLWGRDPGAIRLGGDIIRRALRRQGFSGDRRHGDIHGMFR